MAEQWEAHGPDDFGDFSISAKGEQLAKCVVIQTGFRSPQETRAIAERLIAAVNSHDALVKALEEIANLSGYDMDDGKGARAIAREALTRT
jgi:hypothetical protein